jgi:FixJ family two-component response regulator
MLERPKKVVVVDDDVSIRHSLSSLLRSMGYDSHVFESAEEYLAADIVEDTACIISDVKMSGISGIEMYERLVATGDAPAAIFISAFPTEAVRSRARASGALVLLEKPINADAVDHWVSVATEVRHISNTRPKRK